MSDHVYFFIFHLENEEISFIYYVNISFIYSHFSIENTILIKKPFSSKNVFLFRKKIKIVYIGNINIWIGTFFILMLHTGIKVHKVEAELDRFTTWKIFFSSWFFTLYFSNSTLGLTKKKKKGKKR